MEGHANGRDSVSLGDEAYRRALDAAGLEVVGEYVDEGGSHFYDAIGRKGTFTRLAESSYQVGTHPSRTMWAILDRRFRFQVIP